MRHFQLLRIEDFTGTSGTGYVARGEVLEDGSARMQWNALANLADGSKRKINTVTYYETWQDVVLLHGHSGRTVLEWNDTKETISDLELLGLEDSQAPKAKAA